MSRRWRVLLVALILLLVLGQPALAQGTGGGRVVVGSDVTMGDDEQLLGDLLVIGGDIILQPGSSVRGNTLALGGSVEVAGRVYGDVFAFGGDIRLRGTAFVGGDALASGEVLREEGATVSGVTGSLPRGLDLPVRRGWQRSWVRIALPWDSGFPGSLIPWFLRIVEVAVALVVLGVVLALLIPEPTRTVGRALAGAPAESIGTGLLTGVVAVLALPLLVFTCIGIPLATLALLALVAAALYGWVAAGLLVGQRILQALEQKEQTPAAAVAVGMVALWLAANVPCLGLLAVLLVSAWGIGAVLLTRGGAAPYTRAASRPAPGS